MPDGSKKNEPLSFLPAFNSQGWSTVYNDPLSGNNVIAFVKKIDETRSVRILLDIKKLKPLIDSVKSALIESLKITDKDGTIVLSEQLESASPFYLFAVRKKTTLKHHLEMPNWHLKTIYNPHNTIPLDALRGIIIIVLVSLVLFYCFVSLLAYFAEGFSSNLLLKQLGGIFLAGNCLLWLVAYHMPHESHRVFKHINDTVSCKQFISKTTASARNLHYKTPDFTPIGMLVQGLIINQDNTIQLNALLWQQTQDKNVPLGLAIMYKEQEKGADISENLYNNSTTKMWEFNTKVTSFDNDKLYPLNTTHVAIEITPERLDNSIVLVPDDIMIATTNKPWIGTALQTPGFTLQDSFITTKDRNDGSIKTIYPSVNKKLVFNFIFREELAGALFFYLIPLFLILFALFCLLYFTESPLDCLAVHAGIIFSVVLLHSTLRTARNITTICYLDYFFVYTYIVTIACMLVTVLANWQAKKYIFYYETLQKVFWPVQLLVWLFTTAIIFY